MSAHMPGPMRVLQNAKDDEKATQFLVVTDHGDRPVVLAKVARAGDAELFAAAPDMLEILRDLLNAHYGAVVVSDDPFPEDLDRAAEWIARIHAAIAKAGAR